MEEHRLTRVFAPETSHCRRQYRPTSQRQDHDDAGDREAHPRRLAARLGIVLLVRLRIGHGDPGAIHDLDRTSVPVPGQRHLLLEPLAALVHQAMQQRFGKTLARLAVPTGERRAWVQTLGDPCRIETRDRRTA